MKKLILFVLLIWVSQAKAQVPGYQGLRFSAGYSIDLCSFVSINTLADGQAPHFSLVHHLGVEYATGYKFGLGADVSFANSTQSAKDYDYSGDNYTFNINATRASLNFVFYTPKGAPYAPVGNFVKLKLIAGSYAASNRKTNDNLVSVTESGTGSIYGFGVGIGTTHIISKRLLLSLSIDGDLNWVTPYFVSTPDLVNGVNEFNSHTVAAVSEGYAFYVKVGLGGLLF